MDLPKRLWRFPTRKAIDSLANRFGLANRPDMQDWEREVADPQRVDEFVAAYNTSRLTDDERFTLMEIILQSFEEGSLLNEAKYLSPNRRSAHLLGVVLVLRRRRLA